MALAGCKVLPEAAAAAMLRHSTVQGAAMRAACGPDANGRKCCTGMQCAVVINLTCITW